MNYNITDFHNNSGYNFNSGSGSGSFEEDKYDNKVARYIALSFLICFASMIVICILLLICSELCRKPPRINHYNRDRYSINSFNSNISFESQYSTNYTMNNSPVWKSDNNTNNDTDIYIYLSSISNNNNNVWIIANEVEFSSLNSDTSSETTSVSLISNNRIYY